MIFEHVGRNTELGGKAVPAGAFVEDDRDLARLFPNKFKAVKDAPKGVSVHTVEELEGDDPNDARRSDGSEVIDGGPHQPTAPNQSLDQRARNSGQKGLRVPPKLGPDRGPKAGGGLQGTKNSPDPVGREEAHGENLKASKDAAVKTLKGDKPSRKENPGYKDVTESFEKAGKADLCVIEYDDGGFQIFDADDKDNDDAEPLNKHPLKTKKSVDSFLDKYKAG
jgi:hypothetical protein